MVNTKLKECAEYIEAALEKRMDEIKAGDMANAIAYSVLGGGKRIRAFLVLEFCKLFGGNVSDAEDFACALEMVHAYSLIHDDLPCMDNDDMRRGKPSCHKAYGETVALLAGDALLTYAFETAASSKNNAAQGVKVLAKCAGALGMCRGQEIDLSCTCDSFDELKELHNLKTGALINAACTLGYLASGVDIDESTLEMIEDYALSIGLAFQIIDDLLDVRSTEEELGKPIGSDDKNGKKTVLTFMSESEADKLAYELSTKAAQTFSDLSYSDVVCQLPMYLYKRTK